MLHTSFPSPPHAPRVEPNGPIVKIFLPDRWNPIHVVEAVDSGPPHNHPFGLKANILIGGYIETVWVLTTGGGYTVYYGVERLPGTKHQIDADTIHLITHLPKGFSVTEAEPEEAKQPWFHYLPQDDGSVLRSSNWDGPWEPYHPAGAVVKVNAPDVVAGIPTYKPWVKTAAEAFIAEADWHHKSDSSFIIGGGNTWAQAVEAMEAGHQVRMPTFRHDTTWIIESNSRQILSVLGSTKQEWRESALPVLFHKPEDLPSDWVVLPKIDVEPPVI